MQFVLVDDVVLGKLVEHLLHLGQEFNSSSLIGSSTELAHSVTHRLCIISVVQSTRCSLADSLYR